MGEVCVRLARPSSRTPKLVPVDVLAAQYGITLPAQLPPSYSGSSRMWLNKKLRALQGKNATAWRVIKADPVKHQKVIEQNNSCSKAYRKRKCVFSARDGMALAQVDAYLSTIIGAV
jgi:hypothetical protein